MEKNNNKESLLLIGEILIAAGTAILAHFGKKN